MIQFQKLSHLPGSMRKKSHSQQIQSRGRDRLGRRGKKREGSGSDERKGWEDEGWKRERGMRVRKGRRNGWETGNPRSRAQKRINPTEKKK